MSYFFTTGLKTVRKNGTILENVQVVNTLYEEQLDQSIEVPEKYQCTNIMGTMYDPETQEFYPVEIVREESQLERIERGTNQLLSDIKSEAIDEYTLQLLETGVL